MTHDVSPGFKWYRVSAFDGVGCMKIVSRRFKKLLQEAVLGGYLWRQLDAIGVAGHSAQPKVVLDPEALLVFTAYFGR